MLFLLLQQGKVFQTFNIDKKCTLSRKVFKEIFMPATRCVVVGVP